MRIDILTIFPEMFAGPLTESILKRAVEKELVEIKVHNLRDWSTDKHHTVDAPPYGGGPGMVMRVDVIERAVSEIRNQNSGISKVVLMDTKGSVYNQQKALQLSKVEHLIL